jgi:hypothetical protein
MSHRYLSLGAQQPERNRRICRQRERSNSSTDDDDERERAEGGRVAAGLRRLGIQLQHNDRSVWPDGYWCG